jgi:predicted lipoprotein
MKNLLNLSLITALFINGPTHGQQDNSAEMMKMMTEAQNCMMQLDFQELAMMEQKSKALESDILSLCATGDEAEAKKIALQFSEEVMNSNTMRGMKKCFEGIPHMQEQIKVPDFRAELEQKSICDVVKNK